MDDVPKTKKKSKCKPRKVVCNGETCTIVKSCNDDRLPPPKPLKRSISIITDSRDEDKQQPESPRSKRNRKRREKYAAKKLEKLKQSSEQ